MGNGREWKEKERKRRWGRKKKDTEDMKTRDGEIFFKKINSKLVLTAVAPGDEPGGKLTLL